MALSRGASCLHEDTVRLAHLPAFVLAWRDSVIGPPQGDDDSLLPVFALTLISKLYLRQMPTFQALNFLRLRRLQRALDVALLKLEDDRVVGARLGIQLLPSLGSYVPTWPLRVLYALEEARAIVKLDLLAPEVVLVLSLEVFDYFSHISPLLGHRLHSVVVLFPDLADWEPAFALVLLLPSGSILLLLLRYKILWRLN